MQWIRTSTYELGGRVTIQPTTAAFPRLSCSYECSFDWVLANQWCLAPQNQTHQLCAQFSTFLLLSHPWAEAREELQSPRKPHSLWIEGIYAPGGQNAPHSPSGNLQWTASDEAMGYLLTAVSLSWLIHPAPNKYSLRYIPKVSEFYWRRDNSLTLALRSVSNPDGLQTNEEVKHCLFLGYRVSQGAQPPRTFPYRLPRGLLAPPSFTS